MKSRTITFLLVFFAILVVVAMIVAFVSGDAHGADLSKLSDYETALRYRLNVGTSDNFWADSIIDNCISLAINFVEEHTQCHTAMKTITMNPDTIFYSWPSGVAPERVIAVSKIGQDGELVSLTKRSINDFGKENLNPATIYAFVGDSLVLYKKPDTSDKLYVSYFILSSWISTDTATIPVPSRYRDDVLDYAYADCLRIKQKFELWSSEVARILNNLYGIPKSNVEVVQPMGTATEQK